MAIEATLRLRAELAKEVASGALTPESAMDRLKERDMALGQSDDADFEWALAAIDVGHRLNGSGSIEQALVFFTAAEPVLDRAVSRAPKDDAAARVPLLQQLALLRGRCLGKLLEAELNLAEALKLQPGNDYLLMLRSELIQSNPEVFKSIASEERRE